MRVQRAKEKPHWEPQQHPERQDVQEEFTHLLTSPELVQNHQQQNLTCFRTLKSRKIRTYWHPWQPQACIKYIDEAIIINETAQGQNKKLFPGPKHQTKLAISLRSTGSIWRGKKLCHQLHQPNLCQKKQLCTERRLRASMPRGGVNHLPVLSCSRIHPPSDAYQPPANLTQKCRQKKNQLPGSRDAAVAGAAHTGMSGKLAYKSVINMVDLMGKKVLSSYMPGNPWA